MAIVTRRFNFEKHHEIFARKKFVAEFTTLDEAGDAVDISGWALKFVVRRRGGAANDAEAASVTTAGGGITITNGAGGVCQVVVAASAMTMDPSKDWDYELSRTDSGEEGVLAYGFFPVLQSLT